MPICQFVTLTKKEGLGTSGATQDEGFMLLQFSMINDWKIFLGLVKFSYSLFDVLVNALQ